MAQMLSVPFCFISHWLAYKEVKCCPFNALGFKKKKNHEPTTLFNVISSSVFLNTYIEMWEGSEANVRNLVGFIYFFSLEVTLTPRQ